MKKGDKVLIIKYQKGVPENIVGRRGKISDISGIMLDDMFMVELDLIGREKKCKVYPFHASKLQLWMEPAGMTKSLIGIENSRPQANTIEKFEQRLNELTYLHTYLFSNLSNKTHSAILEAGKSIEVCQEKIALYKGFENNSPN